MSSDDQSTTARDRGIGTRPVAVCCTCLTLIDATVGAWEAEPVAGRDVRCVACGRAADAMVRRVQNTAAPSITD